jgi:hypothetical protein
MPAERVQRILLGVIDDAFPGLRAARITDMTPDRVRALAQLNEYLFLEFKRGTSSDREKERVAEAASAFANTLGGWILLGVEDHPRGIEGWNLGDGVDVQTHVGEILGSRIDPSPPFVTTSVVVDDRRVGVVRIFESADTPHVIKKTGAILVRGHGQTKNMPAQRRDVVDLAERGRMAMESASGRWRALPHALAFYQTLKVQTPFEAPTASALVFAAPVTVPAALDRVAVSESGNRHLRSIVAGKFHAPIAPEMQTFALARGFRLLCEIDPRSGRIECLVDGGGIVAAGWTGSGKRWDSHAFIDGLVEICGAFLDLVEARGRVHWTVLIDAIDERSATQCIICRQTEIPLAAEAGQELAASIKREEERDRGKTVWEPASDVR